MLASNLPDDDLRIFSGHPYAAPEPDYFDGSPACWVTQHADGSTSFHITNTDEVIERDPSADIQAARKFAAWWLTALFGAAAGLLVAMYAAGWVRMLFVAMEGA